MVTATRNWIDEVREARAQIEAIDTARAAASLEERKAETAGNLLSLLHLMIGDPFTVNAVSFHADYLYCARVVVDGYRFGAFHNTNQLLVFRDCPGCGREVSDSIEKPAWRGPFRTHNDQREAEAFQRGQMRLVFVSIIDRMPGASAHDCGRVEGDRNYTPPAPRSERPKNARERLMDAIEDFARGIAMDYIEER